MTRRASRGGRHDVGERHKARTIREESEGQRSERWESELCVMANPYPVTHQGICQPIRRRVDSGGASLLFPFRVYSTRMPSSSFFTVEADELDQRTEMETNIQPDEGILEGAPIQSGRLHELTARGRTLKSTFHPLLSRGHAWITEKHVNARMQSSFIVCIINNIMVIL